MFDRELRGMKAGIDILQVLGFQINLMAGLVFCTAALDEMDRQTV